MKIAVGKYAKAVAAAFASGSAVLASVVSDGHLSNGDVVTVVLAVLATLGVVYTVPNQTP